MSARMVPSAMEPMPNPARLRIWRRVNMMLVDEEELVRLEEGVGELLPDTHGWWRGAREVGLGVPSGGHARFVVFGCADAGDLGIEEEAVRIGARSAIDDKVDLFAFFDLNGGD